MILTNDLKKLTEEVKRLKKENLDLKSSLSSLMKTLSENENLKLPWIGNLGQWYWYVPENIVHFNEGKITAIGYKRDEIEGDVDYQFFTEKLHKDDYDYVMQNMTDHMMGKTPAYEVSYRIQHKNGSYKWYYDRGTIIKRDENNQPLVIAGIVFDITEQKKMEENLVQLNNELREISARDTLTGLYNRGAMKNFLDLEVEQKHKEKSYNFCVIFLDLDGFKNINDTYGHNVGDDLLRELARVIKEKTREKDKLSRFGGDEHVILLPDTKLKEGLQIARRISKSIFSHDFTKGIQMKASLGITECIEDDTVFSLISRADHLMYSAKSNGGNCVKF